VSPFDRDLPRPVRVLNKFLEEVLSQQSEWTLKIKTHRGKITIAESLNNGESKYFPDNFQYLGKEAEFVMEVPNGKNISMNLDDFVRGINELTIRTRERYPFNYTQNQINIVPKALK